MTHVLELNDATVTRQGKKILDHVSWTTSRGEHWVVLGPNGAGKTTLARAISGRCPLDSGGARVNGRAIDSIDPLELNTQIGFASTSLTSKIRPSTTAKDVVCTAAWGVQVPLNEQYEQLDTERADNLMALFGVDGLAQNAFRTLSQGEAQRVVLARAMMTDPEVLVLDEPAAGLDLGAREMLMAALDEIISGPNSPQIILVTHQIEEIPSKITHALLMSRGEIVSQGPIDKVITGVELSSAFNLPLVAGRHEGRWWAHGIQQTH